MRPASLPHTQVFRQSTKSAHAPFFQWPIQPTQSTLPTNSWEVVHDSSPLLTLVRKRLMSVLPRAQLKWSLLPTLPAALLPSLLPPPSSLCNSNLLSINQIKRFCLLTTCQLPPIASSHRLVQGLTQPVRACSVTSSPHPLSPALCSSASGLGLGTHQAPSTSKAPSLLPPSRCFSRQCLARSFTEVRGLLKCHLQESYLPLLLWLERPLAPFLCILILSFLTWVWRDSVFKCSVSLLEG